jgi:hypothetical protein
VSTRKLDLGTADVHQPAASAAKKKPSKKVAKKATAKRGAKRTMKRSGVGSPLLPQSLPATPKPPKGLSINAFIPRGGRLRVRHMTDASQRLCRTFVPLNDAAKADGPVWVQIALPGHFEGHRAGAFDLNSQVFADIIRNYREVDNGEVAFDFEHASELPASEGSVPSSGAPAQGWIKDLKVDGPNLYALVDWLEPARSYIREGKYKYVSPAIRFGARHPTSGRPIGARLTSVALTNQPFLRGLSPLTAKDAAETISMSNYAYSSHEYMPKLRACMRLPELCSAVECAQAMDRLCEAYELGGGAMIHGVDVQSYVSSLRDALNAPLSSTVDEIFDAVKAMIQAAIEEHEAEMHPEMSDEDDSLEDDETETDPEGLDPADDLTGDDDMTPEQLKALETEKAALLTDKATLLSEKTTLANEKASLTLQLKDETAKREAAEAALKEATDKKDAEIVALKAEVAKRDADKAAARVDEAFATYKDAKKLTDDDREAMTIVLSTKPETFEKLYPRVDGSKRHLLQDLSGAKDKTVPSALPGTGSVQVNMREAARALAAKEKISLDEAQSRILTSASKARLSA